MIVVHAEKGGLEFHFENDKIKSAKKVEDIAKIIDLTPKGTGFIFSSSMDFAKEYGFKSWKGAKNLFDKAWNYKK
ncbi:MAG: hypothetical protein CBC24_02700 [Candidatus Pelagibacter sp. TMED64]|nr:hypothetical protein [Candidatus Pelagibacter sp.]OUU66646.1 MAG: hypothetical protein CBC24_02700 [Candidatus Pelagibacter sp. TMED64]|tara:strand:+ start:393 stop:617 length:225 start_codon:yes stop_codon:yes gene_type:complete